jgi:hypothetical protein
MDNERDIKEQNLMNAFRTQKKLKSMFQGEIINRLDDQKDKIAKIAKLKRDRAFIEKVEREYRPLIEFDY